VYSRPRRPTYLELDPALHAVRADLKVVHSYVCHEKDYLLTVAMPPDLEHQIGQYDLLVA